MFANSTSENRLTGIFHGAIVTAAVFVLSGCAHWHDHYGSSDAGSLNPSDLQKILTEHGYTVALVVGPESLVSLIGPDGKPIPHCGSIGPDGTVIESPKLNDDERCNLKGVDLLKLQTVQLFLIEQNPTCMVIRKGGKLYKVHAGGDGFPPGAYPCHAQH